MSIVFKFNYYCYSVQKKAHFISGNKLPCKLTVLISSVLVVPPQSLLLFSLKGDFESLNII